MVNKNEYPKMVGGHEDKGTNIARVFSKFIDDNKFTSKQMRKALSRLYNIEEDDTNEDVEKIFEEMKKMEENGLSLNRIAELVEAKEEQENTLPRYYKYVEGLDISLKEKKMLHSIVEKKRSGQLELLVDGKVIFGSKIAKADAPVETLANEAMLIIGEVIKRIPEGKKCEFMFVED